MTARVTARQIVLNVVILLAALYLVAALLAWFLGERLIFLPRPASYDRGAESVLVPVAGTGDSIAVRWLPNPDARHVLLYSHGNAEDIGDLERLLAHLRDAGFSVLADDYRGYGLSTGRRSSEQGAYLDHEAAYRYLTGPLGVPAGRVILHGRSLGGGIASELAARCPVAGLILESTFTSTLRVVAPRIFPFDRFGTAARMGRIQVPVLVIHGTADRVIPFTHGQQLHRAARNPAPPLWVAGAGHDDVAWTGGEAYVDALRRFSASLPEPPRPHGDPCGSSR